MGRINLKRFMMAGKQVSLNKLMSMYWAGHFIRLKWMTEITTARQKYAVDYIDISYDETLRRLNVMHKNGHVVFINFNDLDFQLNYLYSE